MRTTTIAMMTVSLALSVAGCSAMIEFEDFGPCGNGIFEPQLDEECDNGAENSDTVPNACRTDCHNPYCGDGVTDEGESCDSGEHNGEPDQCNMSCDGFNTSAVCGNGTIEPPEQCDGELSGDTNCGQYDPYTGGVLSCDNLCRLDASGCDTSTTCFPVAQLECGAAVASTTTAVGSTNTMDDHCGLGFPAPGREITYSFTGMTDEWVHVDLRGLTGNLDVIIYRTGDGVCGPDQCVAAGLHDAINGDVSREFVSFMSHGGEEYLIVIDGYDGALSDFELLLHCGEKEDCENGVDDLDNGLVDCADPTCFDEPICPETQCGDGIDNNNSGAADCADPSCQMAVECTCSTSGTLTCGENQGFTTVGSESTITGGWCGFGPEYTGPERVFALNVGTATQLEVQLTGLSDNLDLFLLRREVGVQECLTSQCLYSSLTGGPDNEYITFAPLAAYEYLLVVDGYQGASSPFDINITCTP